MEIIHLILGKANPNRMNGVNKVVHQLATKQFAFGKKVTVWGITKELTHNYDQRNFETRLFKAQKNNFFVDAELKQEILKKKGKAVFHLHGGWIPTYFTLSKFMHKHSIPFIITAHGAYNEIAMQRSKWVKKLYFTFFEKSVLRRAQKIHLIGASEIIGLQKMYPNTKTELIPYGFESSYQQVQKSGHIDLLHSDFVVGFVGRLDVYTKGLDLLIKAFSVFENKKDNVKLWIIGDSKEMPILKALIKENKLENTVILFGKKFGSEKIDLMRQMDVFVHSSRNEGLPASVLEACDLGIPCVVTEATNIGANIQKSAAGIVVKNEDSLGLAKAFIDLYEKKQSGELAQMGANAQAMVTNQYNWEKTVNDFNALYV